MTVTYAATPLSYVLADIERASDKSIVRSLAVDTLLLSVRFTAAHWRTVLATVVQSKALYAFPLSSGAIAVRTGAEDAALLETEPTVDRVVTLSCLKPSQAHTLLSGATSNRGRVLRDTMSNTIILREAASRIEQFHALALSLDRKPPC